MPGVNQSAAGGQGGKRGKGGKTSSRSGSFADELANYLANVPPHLSKERQDYRMRRMKAAAFTGGGVGVGGWETERSRQQNYFVP